jgi:hypothetical protein
VKRTSDIDAIVGRFAIHRNTPLLSSLRQRLGICLVANSLCRKLLGNLLNEIIYIKRADLAAVSRCASVLHLLVGGGQLALIRAKLL